jgi:nucleotide-binding universal stress UspA family protein
MARYVESAARLLGADVALLHVVDTRSFSAVEGMSAYARPPADVIADHQAVVREKLEAFLAAEFPNPGVRRVLAMGDAAATIVRVASEQGFDFIIMPTHEGQRFRRMLLGSTTAKVLNESPIPVLTSAHSETISPSGRPQKKWLCALDLTAYAEKVLAAAKDLTERAGGELSIVHVVPEDGLGASLRELYDQTSSRRIPEASEKIDQLLRRMGFAAPVHVMAGPVKECLLQKAAAESADVVIMGRTGQSSAFERLRDLTYVMVRDSPCPVLSI